MKKELQDKLYEKYPKIFIQKDLPKSQSCMYQGITVGDGWYNLIDEMCTKIATLDTKVEAVQVKEKFGGLRFYVTESTEEVDDIILEYTCESLHVCETCGSTLDVQLTVGGWIHSLCAGCQILASKKNKSTA